MTQNKKDKMTQNGIRHHLSEETLMAYAAGTLPEAFSLLVASHVSMCDHCRADIEAYEAVGGALLMRDPVTLDEQSLAQVMARLDGTEIEAPRLAPASGDLPAPLRDYIGGDLADVRWRPLGMGVRQAILPVAKGATARLLHIPAGAAMPDHGHHGTEMTLVLRGAFHDADGYFCRGDVEVADSDLQHIPVADIGEDCICLAVTDAPLRFSGLLPRIWQKFVRI